MFVALELFTCVIRFSKLNLCENTNRKASNDLHAILMHKYWPKEIYLEIRNIWMDERDMERMSIGLMFFQTNVASCSKVGIVLCMIWQLHISHEIQNKPIKREQIMCLLSCDTNKQMLKLVTIMDKQLLNLNINHWTQLKS